MAPELTSSALDRFGFVLGDILRRGARS